MTLRDLALILGMALAYLLASGTEPRPRGNVTVIARWPIGSCPECYDAGTPERPVCDPHGHELVSTGVTLCDVHDHVSRRRECA